MSKTVELERPNQVTSICVVPSQWAAVKKLAYETGKTQASIVREALTLYFAKLARERDRAGA
jgi:predicted DNA-binding protein